MIALMVTTAQAVRAAESTGGAEPGPDRGVEAGGDADEPRATAAPQGASPGSAAEPVSVSEGEEPVDVLVVGTPVDASPRDPTPATYVVDGEALATPGLDVADALDRVPGAQTARSGGAADPATASLRGAGSAQVPVYLAGLRLNDELTGAADLSTLPAWLLHRLEVYRGHAPRTVDQLGLGGAIVLEPRLPNGEHASAAAGAGSFGWREGRAALSLGDDEAAALLAVGRRRGDGDFLFEDDAGTRFDPDDDVLRRRRNADHRELDAWAIARVRGEGARLVAVAHGFSRDGGAPGLLLPGARRSRVAVRRALGAVSARVDAGAHLRLTADAGMIRGRYRLSDPARELGPSRRVDNATGRATHRLRLEARPLRRAALGISMAVARTRLSLDRDGEAAERADRFRLRPALDGRWSPIPELDVVAVAAVDCQTTRGSADAGERCSVLEPVGRLGARAEPWPFLSVFGNLGRYVRVPTLGERYGVSAAALGNTGLEPETGYSAELGTRLRARAEPVVPYAEVVGFSRFASDLVSYRRASLGAVRPFNVGAARVLGIEALGGLRLGRFLDARVAVTAMDPRDVSEGREVENDQLPHVARLAVVPSLVLTSPSWNAVGLRDARLVARFRYQSPRVADPAGLLELPAQHLLELGAGLSFDSGIALRLRLENLLDDRTFDVIGYPLPGRAAYGLVEVGW